MDIETEREMRRELLTQAWSAYRDNTVMVWTLIEIRTLELADILPDESAEKERLIQDAAFAAERIRALSEGV